MPHKNYYKFKAKDNYELGLKMGSQFADTAKKFWTEAKQDSSWPDRLRRSKDFLKLNEQHFPKYADEMRGYAKGAGIPFEDLYVLNLEDEVTDEFYNHCTTMITNNGLLFAHNEDWGDLGKDRINVVEKTIGDLSVFELYYINTLGGNSISINSNGFIIGINSLNSTDTKIGLSKNVLCRWMQEISDPDKNIKILESLPRAVGYNYNIANKIGELWNIEYSSSFLNSSKPISPFCHSNHHLSELSKFEANTNKKGTFERYSLAAAGTKPVMTVVEMMSLMNDTSLGEVKSIMNNETIAKIIVDIKNKIAKIWLLREDELGFVDYGLGNYFA